VGKKGELYTPKELRLQIGLDPGSELIAQVKGEQIILRKRKTALRAMILCGYESCI